MGFSGDDGVSEVECGYIEKNKNKLLGFIPHRLRLCYNQPSSIKRNIISLKSTQNGEPSHCLAHENKFRFKKETLYKLLDSYTKTRLIKNVQSRKDAESDLVFEHLDEHERNILFWLTCTDIYKVRPNYDYYKVFNVKK